MILELCDKILNNMKMKMISVNNDLNAFNKIILKIEDSFIKNETKMDIDSQTAIYDVLYEIGININELGTFITEVEAEIESLSDNMITIRENT